MLYKMLCWSWSTWSGRCPVLCGGLAKICTAMGIKASPGVVPACPATASLKLCCCSESFQSNVLVTSELYDMTPPSCSASRCSNQQPAPSSTPADNIPSPTRSANILDVG
eukprot:CAMPEP_0198688442 /NCGR_PEP_ID=MMETSP1468-20131203/104571_1 /TAXON_ID=1461545 /ORGANISM="Mantoniella sp, Strain CCMP1436" /LENGTH=109 /DNA_ID=CAMNT_0044438043 /DNA_START=342 /DNA_END=674 /DNA_ORIENTATION=-